jgi:hypothetical protein
MRRKFSFNGSQINLLRVYKLSTGIDVSNNQWTLICDVCDVQLQAEYEKRETGGNETHSLALGGQFNDLEQTFDGAKTG